MDYTQQSTSEISRNLFAGLVTSLIVLVYTITCAVLVFSGDLKTYLPLGISCALLSSTIANLLNSFRSSMKFAIYAPNPIPTVILALLIAKVAAANPQAPTIVATLMICALVTGVSNYLLGFFRLGNLIRYIPYPVVGGA